MFKKGQVCTETDKGPFWFTLIAFVFGTAGTVLLFVLGGGDALAVFAGILLGTVALAAGGVLFALITDRAYIDNGVLHMSYMFKRKSISIDEIGKITLKDEVYSVYDKKAPSRGRSIQNSPAWET